MIFRASLLAFGLGGSAFAQDQIEVQSLSALDPLEVGLPDAGLRERLWDGTDAGMALRVLEELPDAAGEGYASAYAADLARSVLSSGGYPPAGGRGNPDLAVLRLDRLLAAAGPYDAYDLLERTPNINQNPDLSYEYAELAFALGDHAGACRAADSLLTDRDQPYWLRARAYCLALNDQGAAAELTAELAGSTLPDAGFDTLLFAITLGNGVSGEMPAIDSGLKMAMSAQVSTEMSTPGPLAETAPGWLRRLQTERTASDLIQADDPLALLVQAAEQTGVERTALLEAVLVQGMDRELAAQALAELLNDAKSEGRFANAARFYGREINALPINEDSLQHGFDFVLAALLVDDVRTASRWRDGLLYGPVRAMPDVSLEPEKKPTSLDPEVSIDEPATTDFVTPPEWVPPAMERMVVLDLAIAIANENVSGIEFTAIQGIFLESQPNVALPVIYALSRLGVEPPRNLRPALMDVEMSQNHPSILVMEAASRDGAQAETMLLALSAMSDREHDLSIDELGRIVEALERIGMRDAALGLILERIIAGVL